MTHNYICKQFQELFPRESKFVEMWFPNGKHSIRVRLTTKQEFIFTYNDKANWRLETIDSYIEGMKKGLK